MPELPEVETIKKGLEALILEVKILTCKIHCFKLRYPVTSKLETYLKNNRILDIKRHAKYLILKFNNGSLLLHFGMSGKMAIKKNTRRLPHEHMTLKLENKSSIAFIDPRKFGAILWLQDPIESHPLIKNLGLEPFSKKYNKDYLFQITSKRKVSIKELLMNSQVVTGIGNIYASEILFQSNINPNRLAKTMSLEDCHKICLASKSVLKKAIKAGGTSLRDYRTLDSHVGYFKQKLKVYGRGGENCLICKNHIKKIRQNNRSTYYCDVCQI